MYLVSVYFDEQAEKRIRQYIKQIAKRSGNFYMLDANVPPHITISAFETKMEDKVISLLEYQVIPRLRSGTVQWVCAGVFFPSVIYLEPVLNSYLYDMMVAVYEGINAVEGISIRKCYRPLQWLPHTTVGKNLSKEEMMKAFQVLQESFGVFEGSITRIGFAKTNPHHEMIGWDLR